MHTPSILPRRTSHPQHTAFTLIELLVVVAIISVLASMLMPALNKARSVARGSYCMNNLKQINIAFMYYSDDEDDFLPPVNSSKAPSSDPRKTTKDYGMWPALGVYTGFPQWGGLLEPPTSNDDPTHIKYVGYWGAYKIKFSLGDTMWACPDVYDDTKHPWNDIYGESLFITSTSGTASTAIYGVARKLNAERQPEQKIHVSDSGDWHLGKASDVRIAVPGSAFELFRHYGGASVSFVDGHVAHYEANTVKKQITNDFRLP